MEILLNFHLLLCGRVEVLISIREMKAHHDIAPWQSQSSELWVSQHSNSSSTCLKVGPPTAHPYGSRISLLSHSCHEIFLPSVLCILAVCSWLAPFFECLQVATWLVDALSSMLAEGLGKCWSGK